MVYQVDFCFGEKMFVSQSLQLGVVKQVTPDRVECLSQKFRNSRENVNVLKNKNWSQEPEFYSQVKYLVW